MSGYARDMKRLERSRNHFGCGKCGDIVPEAGARDHIRACWGHSIKDSDPIPHKVIIDNPKPQGLRLPFVHRTKGLTVTSTRTPSTQTATSVPDA